MFGENVAKIIKLDLALEYLNTVKKRILDKVKYVNDCWNWTGQVRKNGYGTIKLMLPEKQRKMLSTHRVFYYIHNPSFDQTKMILHKCDNRLCLNPEHLYEGTAQQNMNDRSLRKRYTPIKKTHCKHGHEFTIENTKFDKKRNKRACRTCMRRLWSEYYWRNKNETFR